tara:strand:- start:55 stop:633 length:579 start_codon:yes stop_codon:yes gene_type:complete
MALLYSKVSYEHREILLRERPKILFKLSSKGTVPVLQLMNGTVIDESLDIMKWCLKQNDLKGWYEDDILLQDKMILKNDNQFKYWLDRYKYHVRYKEFSFEEHQNKIKKYFDYYNRILKNNPFLLGEKINLVDIAIMPFVRQAAHVDLNWFVKTFPALQIWLEKLKGNSLFLTTMTKYEVWKEKSPKNIVKW